MAGLALINDWINGEPQMARILSLERITISHDRMLRHHLREGINAGLIIVKIHRRVSPPPLPRLFIDRVTLCLYEFPCLYALAERERSV